MSILKKTFFCGFVAIFCIFNLQARDIIKDTMQSEFVMRVNGELFARRVEVDSGVKTAQFMVNNQVVAAEVFEDQLVRAEAEERRRDLQRETELFGVREQEEQSTRILVTKKLLSQLIDRCKRDLGLLEKFALERYFAFSPDTLTREDYEHVVTGLIPAALKASSQDTGAEKIAELYEELAGYERPINSFVFATIRRAIEQVSDPKLLKELLAVVS